MSLLLPLGFPGQAQEQKAGGETKPGFQRIGDYHFSMNGKPFRPRVFYLHGEPGNPVPGDLIRLGWMYVPLGEEREWNLEEQNVSPYAVRRIHGQERRWLAVSTERGFLNGLAGLSPDELKELRAVSFRVWDDTVARQAALLDGDRVSIRFYEDAIAGRPGTLPPLPEGLRYFFLQDSSPPIVTDFTPVTRLDKLELLDVDRGELDLRLLEPLHRLRFLRTGPAARVRNVESLGKLTALRELHLDDCESLVDLGAVLPCSELRVLSIARTGVKDLSPLTALVHLQSIDADGSPVSKLPAHRMPSLRSLSLVDTPISSREMAAFREWNPGCTVYPRGAEAFRAALAGVDRIRVHWLTWPDGRHTENAADVVDPAAIAELASAVSIQEVQATGCACIRDTWIELFRGGAEAVEAASIHHGRILYSSMFGGAATLEPESARRVCQWLHDHGAKGPKEELDGDERARAEADRRGARGWMDGLWGHVVIAAVAAGVLSGLAIVMLRSRRR